ncbi:phenylacetate-CoA oxygenase subunit PaaI [Chromatiales bacterium (ex Bugula neritina AB1)]|nr:phenylacetate-CoA oxygenase subunit PaaI [Chromatiales bacterium (ex Bugula neritina AB1)]
MVYKRALIETVVQLADDHLILGHRLSQWCGHAPMLEEDLSMPNMALDLVGQARNLYSYAAELEGEDRSEDDLAYLRTDREYRNCLLVERPNTDFAYTMVRQLYFTAFMRPFWQGVLTGSDTTLAGIAGKAIKETGYHLRHSGEWVVRLGDGTEESSRRMKDAVSTLHPYTDELFSVDAGRQQCIEQGIVPGPEQLRAAWCSTIKSVFSQALLEVPEVEYPLCGGRDGRHTEDFGYLLADLQYLQRTYPGAQW